jgi:hypothetical protein
VKEVSESIKEVSDRLHKIEEEIEVGDKIKKQESEKLTCHINELNLKMERSAVSY